MTLIRRMCCEIRQGVPRAAAAAGLAVVLLSIAPLPVAAQAEDVTSSAEDAAVTTATEQAASQAASEAASQAASQAVSEAASEAASRAANDAATQAANQAAAEAVAGASDRAATSISDQTATSVSDQAASAVGSQSTTSASERAAESSTVATTSALSSDQSGSAAEQARHSMTEQTAGTTAVSGETSSAQSSSTETETERKSESGESAFGESAQAAAVEAALDVVKGFDGSEVNAREVVVLLSKADVPAIRSLDYKLVAQTPLDSLGGQLLRVRVPAGVTIEAALHTIELAAPGVVAAPNHVFRTAGEGGGKFWQPWRRQMAALWARPAPRPGSAKQVSFEGVVGVIDTPVDPSYPGLTPAVVATYSFADGTPASAAHGTAVAELIAEQHVRVIAANVFAKDGHGNAAATTDSILRALDWLVAHRATVINMSMEGPLDGALRAAVARAQAKGCIIVAAAGNKGPAAPPSYPGAFPAVVAVTAIDKNDQVYPYANQGHGDAFGLTVIWG